MAKFIYGIILSASMLFNSLFAQLVYEEKPKDFNPKIEVATCFIKVGDEVLFLKRLPNKPQGNTWGIPGGKLDKGENAEEAVVREVWEETGIELPNDDLSYVGKVYIRYPQMDYVFHMFEYQSKDDLRVKINPGEHADYRWVTLEEALAAMALIPGEEELIDLAYGVQASNGTG